MKKTRPPVLFSSSAIAIGTLALLAESALAASISITSGPTSGVSGGVIENSQTFGFTPVAANIVKITGIGDYTATSGGLAVITLDIGGLVSADSGDTLSLDYDFSFNFTGTGTLDWTIDTEIDLGFISISGPSSSGGPITSADSGDFSGLKSTESPLTANDLAWSAVFTVTWTGATAGDTLSVNIPDNSIDIAVVPEPSSMLLLGLGGVFAFRRRR